jgi:hypothetical protein
VDLLCADAPILGDGIIYFIFMALGRSWPKQRVTALPDKEIGLQPHQGDVAQAKIMY